MILSRRNETLKAIRGLRRKQGDHLLIEGPELFDAAARAAIRFETVLMTPEFGAGEAGRRIARGLDRPPLTVARELLEELADADSPRGILALARLPRGAEECVPLAPEGLYLYLDGVQEPGNLGAIARAAEAFEVAALLLAPGCAHPNHPRALRGSAGSLLRIPVGREVTIHSLDRRLAELAPRWAGLDAHGGENLPDRRPGGCWIVALGAEGGGLSAETAARLDTRWTIPIAGAVESLNVAVAAGIALHALRRRS
jgi:TrmH family RNA methyltransferase